MRALLETVRQAQLYLATIGGEVSDMTDEQRDALLSDLDHAQAPAEQLEERLETWGSVSEEENPRDDDEEDEEDDDDDGSEDNE